MKIDGLCKALNESCDRITLVRAKWRRMPPKWPRGELLCENFEGSRVYSYPTLKVKAWLLATGLAKVNIHTGSLVPCDD